MSELLSNIYVGIRIDLFLKFLQGPIFPRTRLRFTVLLSPDKILLRQLYVALSNLPNDNDLRFFFILSKNDFESSGQLDDIGRFFFLPTYLQENINTPLLLLNRNFTEADRNSIRLWYQQQGFNKLEFKSIYNFETVLDDSKHVPLITSPNKELFLSSLLKLPYSWENLLQLSIIEILNLHELEKLESNITHFEASIKRDQPEIYKLLLRTVALEVEHSKERATIAFLQSEVSNLKIYNKELQSENEVRHILDFYHTQYEVLPLWYKRFGHVIKILTGKRKVSFIPNWKKP